MLLAPRDFRIDVPDAVLADLRDRLARTRWAEALPGRAWERGASVEYVKGLCAYWQSEYDWRKQEAALNAYPQFVSKIDGVDFHFWHVKSKSPTALPLILVHGWPGSIYEFHHLIGQLTDPAAHGCDAADAFDVVIPALPGYGFSGKPKDAGWGPERTAKAFDTLMSGELGYARYGTQGGDWGAIVTSLMAANHGEHVAGAHLNMIFAPPPPEQAAALDAKPYLDRAAAFQRDETG